MKFCSSDIVKVTVLDNYNLHLQFEDGVSGEIDISQIIPFEGVFKPLKDKAYFSRVSVNPNVGTICWENGADLSPAFLHKKIIKY